jgi:hypothetical protein
MDNSWVKREAGFLEKRNAADKLSAQIAANRLKKLQADAMKTAPLRDQRLAKEAMDALEAIEATTSEFKRTQRRGTV